MNTNVHSYIDRFINTFIQTLRHTCLQACIYTYVHKSIHIHIRTHIGTWIHTCIHTYVQTNMHTNTYFAFARSVLLQTKRGYDAMPTRHRLTGAEARAAATRAKGSRGRTAEARTAEEWQERRGPRAAEGGQQHRRARGSGDSISAYNMEVVAEKWSLAMPRDPRRAGTRAPGRPAGSRAPGVGIARGPRVLQRRGRRCLRGLHSRQTLVEKRRI